MLLLNRSFTNAAALVVSVLFAVQAPAETLQLDSNLQRMQMKTEPSLELLKKKIFVEFKGSPKASKMLREQFRAKGFAIVENAEDAEAKFLFAGLFSVNGAGKQGINNRPLAELFENSTTIEIPDSPNYQHQSIDLPQIAVSSVVMKAISATDILLWFSQVTGVAGRFNEALTGDPRGICMQKDCEKLLSSVALYVTGNDENGKWRISSGARNEKPVLDIVIADAMERALAPLFDLQKNKVPMANAGEASK